MTTARSPEHLLRQQADKIATALKNPDGKKIKRVEGERIKFAVVMDDKTITVDLPWSEIDGMTKEGISDRMLELMRRTK